MVVRTPPAEVLARWTLASHDGWSHVICVPGVTQDHIDGFVDALASTMAPAVPAVPAVSPLRLRRARPSAASADYREANAG